MGKIKSNYQKMVRFLTHDIWHLDGTMYGRWKAKGVHYLKVLLITIKGVSTHKTGMQSAALTFFTLLALVPFMALVYAVTKGFGFAKELESMIYANFSEQEEAVAWVLRFANNLLDTGKSGFFGIIGFLTFLWSVVWVMISVEQIFNHVWQVKNDKSVLRKVLIYFALIIFIPVITGGSFLIPLSYKHLIQNIGWDVKFLSSLKPVVGWLLHFAYTGTLFFMAFKWIPNTKVRAMPALNATIFTTVAFVVIQALYVETQLFVSKLNAIYGAFAALPFFMIWLNTNWFLILLGVEISYAYQNIDHYGTKKSI